MADVSTQSERRKRIGSEELNFEDKMVLLRERYKRVGEDLHTIVGVTRISLSRWLNGHTHEIKPDLWARLVTASKGLLSETDHPRRVHVEPKPATKAASVAKPAPATPKDDEEFIL